MIINGKWGLKTWEDRIGGVDINGINWSCSYLPAASVICGRVLYWRQGGSNKWRHLKPFLPPPASAIFSRVIASRRYTSNLATSNPKIGKKLNPINVQKCRVINVDRSVIWSLKRKHSMIIVLRKHFCRWRASRCRCNRHLSFRIVRHLWNTTF